MEKKALGIAIVLGALCAAPAHAEMVDCGEYALALPVHHIAPVAHIAARRTHHGSPGTTAHAWRAHHWCLVGETNAANEDGGHTGGGYADNGWYSGEGGDSAGGASYGGDGGGFGNSGGGGLGGLVVAKEPPAGLPDMPTGGGSAPVPETSTLIMMLAGFVGLGYAAKRRKTA